MCIRDSLMIGLNGYTLCSGIICDELNGSNYRAVPFLDEDDSEGNRMDIGYITRKNLTLSRLGDRYVSALKKYLDESSREYEEI